MTAEQIYEDVLKHVGVDSFNNWYVGITSDIHQRLFSDHAVDPVNHKWIHAKALNAEHARIAESALLRAGFDGGTGGGDTTSMHVYAFRKTYGTVR